MKLQRYEVLSQRIKSDFLRLKQEHPERLEQRISLSFSIPAFGLEPVTESIDRLGALGYRYAELPGNYGGRDIGNHIYAEEIRAKLDEWGMACSGVCPFTLPGMAFTERDGFGKQKALDYLQGNVEFCRMIGGSYYLITPGPVGIGAPEDSGAYARSIAFLKENAYIFADNDVKCAIEICHRGAVPFCHTIAEARSYMQEVDHPSVQWIYGDMKHLLAGEPHLGKAVLDCGKQLLCLHLRDTYNGGPIGNGMMDLDTVIRALYLIGFNRDGCYAVGEPTASAYLPDGGFDPFVPYPEEVKYRIAKETLEYFREREAAVLEETTK